MKGNCNCLIYGSDMGGSEDEGFWDATLCRLLELFATSIHGATLQTI
jgi:hypothetical protein